MANDSGRIPGDGRSPGAKIFRAVADGGPAGVWAESSSGSDDVCGAGVKMVDSLEMATATHTGMVRSHNEDSVIVEADIGLAVLADGMGGYNAGEVASGIATALITDETKQALMRNDLQKPKGEDVNLRLVPCCMTWWRRRMIRSIRRQITSPSMRAWEQRSSSACSLMTR